MNLDKVLTKTNMLHFQKFIALPLFLAVLICGGGEVQLMRFTKSTQAILNSSAKASTLSSEALKTAGQSIDDFARIARSQGISDDVIRKAGDSIIDAVESGAKATKPTLPAGGKPKGSYEAPSNPNDPTNVASIQKQNQTADLLAEKGFDIEMLPEIKGGNGYGIKPESNPDFLIDGKAFDCYSPTITNPRGAWTVLQHPTKGKTTQQASRIVMNLDNYTGATIDDIVKQFLNWDISTLDELIIIKGEEIIHLIVK